MSTNTKSQEKTAYLGLSYSIKYRPDIDGLRAVAVISVVASHAFPSLIKGGFIGVDIFFVISGFLISSIIFNNLEHGTFSFYDFYSRRIRRIFPALITVLIFCYLFGWFSLLADEYKQLGKHIAAGAGFVSNFVLWSESGYFDYTSETKPLLHLWSLGIEEQFYIVWPLLLWSAWKKKTSIKTTLIILFSISFVINLLKYRADGVADFFSPQTRFWELLAGSLLAYSKIPGAQNNEGLTKESNALRNTQSFFGATLIFLGLFFITKEKHFPGTWAILPVLGSTQIIAAGPKAWINRVFLSNRIMLWFGIISFPLYLWHWPLLSFSRIIEGKLPDASIRAAVVLLSIVLAWLTYKLVELPLKDWHKNKFKFLFLIFLMVLLGSAGYATYKNNGLQFRLSQYQQREIHPLTAHTHINNYENTALFKAIWKGAPAIKSRDFLLSNNEGKSASIAIIGDSHANRLYLGLERQSQLSIFNIGRGTCPPFLNTDVIDKQNQSLSCQPLANNYLKYIKDNKDIQTIIINAFYIQYARDSALSDHGKIISVPQAIANTTKYLVNSGKTVIIVFDVPEVPADCYQKTNIRSLPVWKTKNNTHCLTNRNTINLFNKEILDAISQTAPSPRTVFFLDPADALCKDNLCGEIDNKNYLYNTDGNHLNDLGTRIIGKWLLGELKTINAQPIK